MVGQGVNDAVDNLRVDEGPRRILDQHLVRPEASERLKTRQHRGLAVRAADYWR